MADGSPGHLDLPKARLALGSPCGPSVVDVLLVPVARGPGAPVYGVNLAWQAWIFPVSVPAADRHAVSFWALLSVWFVCAVAPAA
jgi:hypothetical protein